MSHSRKENHTFPRDITILITDSKSKNDAFCFCPQFAERLMQER